MAVNIPEMDGITRSIQKEFVKPLRRPLTGFRLFAGKEVKTESWSQESHTWFETEEMADVVVSMDLPPIQSSSVNVAPKTIGVPLLTKDLVLGGRKAEQIRRAGLDPVLTDGMARAMAEEMERALLVGFPAKSGGPTTGLLNDAASPASVSLGAWTDADAINEGLSALIADAIVDEMEGPYALVVNRADVKYLQSFIPGQSVRIGDNLPGRLVGAPNSGIVSILPTTFVNSGTVKLIDMTEGNFHAISPQNEGSLTFGLGTVTTGEVARSSLMTETDPIMMSRTWRNLNCIVPRLVRKTAVRSGAFTPS